jgi:hypothetical protein
MHLLVCYNQTTKLGNCYLEPFYHVHLSRILPAFYYALQLTKAFNYATHKLIKISAGHDVVLQSKTGTSLSASFRIPKFWDFCQICQS